MPHQFFVSLEKAGEKKYELNVTLSAFVFAALNACFLFFHYFSDLYAYREEEILQVVLASNLLIAAFFSILALRDLPDLFGNPAGNLLLALSWLLVLGFVMKFGAVMLFDDMLDCLLIALASVALTMAVVPLGIIISTEGELSLRITRMEMP